MTGALAHHHGFTGQHFLIRHDSVNLCSVFFARILGFIGILRRAEVWSLLRDAKSSPLKLMGGWLLSGEAYEGQIERRLSLRNFERMSLGVENVVV